VSSQWLVGGEEVRCRLSERPVGRCAQLVPAPLTAPHPSNLASPHHSPHT